MITDVVVGLNNSNTTIIDSTLAYNIEVIVNLSSLEEYLKNNKDKCNRIFVETNLEVPVIYDNMPMTNTFSLINNYYFTQIVNNEVMQYGYYEGVLDESREIKKTSNIWVYSLMEPK